MVLVVVMVTSSAGIAEVGLLWVVLLSRVTQWNAAGGRGVKKLGSALRRRHEVGPGATKAPMGFLYKRK